MFLSGPSSQPSGGNGRFFLIFFLLFNQGVHADDAGEPGPDREAPRGTLQKLCGINCLDGICRRPEIAG
jgi:hypothetical protein